MKILLFIKKYSVLFGILLLTIFLRIYPIFPDYFTFMFDHAKDALVIMDMGVHHHLPLLGTATSINGLFNGPFWYYFLFPFNVLGRYHPLSSIVGILFLSCVTVYVLWKRFGTALAFLFAVSIGLIGSQQSAWSPYATPFPVFGIILLLYTLAEKRKRIWKQIFLLGFFVSLLFHLQIAFAVVITPLTLISVLLLIRNRGRNLLQSLAVFFIGFSIPFLPFLAFETRHHFQQTRQIIDFVQQYNTQSNVISPKSANIINRFGEVFQYTYQVSTQAVSPITIKTPIVGISVLFLMLVYLFSKKGKNDRNIMLPFLIGTPLLYMILPVKSYYFVGLLPFFLIIFRNMLKLLPKKYLIILCVTFLILAVLNGVDARFQYLRLAQTGSILLHPKIQAVKTVHALSNNLPFSSFQYVPEIYDYTYQFIYFYEYQFIHKLPTEFSYTHGEYAYMTSMAHLPPKELPSLSFLIEENGQTPLGEQWHQKSVGGKTILKSVHINDTIAVHEVEK